MRVTLSFMKRLGRDQRGATVVEYGLIIAGIVLAIFGAVQTLGSATGSMWNNVSSNIIKVS